MVTYKRIEIAGQNQVDHLADEIVRRSTVPYFTHGRNYRADVHCIIGDDEIGIKGNVRKPNGLHVDYEGIAREVIEESGYLETGDISDDFNVVVDVRDQEVNVADGLNETGGIGDSGHGYGWSTDETPQGVSMATLISREIANMLNEAIESNPDLGPDLKTNFAFSYNGSKELTGLAKADIAIQHRNYLKNGDIREIVWEGIVRPYLESLGISYDVSRIKVNHGEFTTGGPKADGGHSNARVALQAYGEQFMIPFVESFFGRSNDKDSLPPPLWSRYVANNLRAAGLADQCVVGYSCSITEPGLDLVSVEGLKEGVDEKKVLEFVHYRFGNKINDIIKTLDLNNPKNYPRELITQGIFGYGSDHISWEKIILSPDDPDVKSLWK